MAHIQKQGIGMNSQESQRQLASRRDFAKLLGLGVAASTIASSVAAPAETAGADLDALARLATDGSAAHLGAEELADLKREIQEDQKALDKIREFRVDAALEPAMVFHPR